MAKSFNIIVNPVFDGWSPLDTRLGGTEESVVAWGEELAKRGYRVTVYKNGTWTGKHNEVEYLHYENYVPADYTLNVKYNSFRTPKNTWYFTNETNASELDLSHYEGVIMPSKWAIDNITVNNQVRVVPHGYYRDRIYPDTKIPKSVLYASSPDRGLDTLVRIWPEIVEVHPEAILFVTYGVTSLDIPNVMCMGETDEDTMNQLFRSSDIWCHPCNGGELFGITGIKAQVASCIPVYYPMMALRETVRVGVACTNEQMLKGELMDILGNEKRKQYYRSRLANEDFPDWKETTDILENIVVQS